MRVVVTGGTGFVGSHAAAALLAAGHDVRLLVRDPGRLEGPDRAALAAMDHVVGDVTDRASVVRALDGCDAVLHAAGAMTFDGRRRAEARRVNVEGTTVVLQAALDRGADPVVFVSSISALWPPTGAILGVDEEPKPSGSVYGGSKAVAEGVARRLQEKGEPVVITYPGGVFGPGDPYTGEVTRGLIWLLRLGIVPGGPGGFPMVDARDLATALASALTAGMGPRRYMLGGRLLEARQLAELLSAVTARRFLALPLPPGLLRGIGRAGDVLNRRMSLSLPFTTEGMDTVIRAVPFDNSAAETDLGFAMRDPRLTLGDGIRWLHERSLITSRMAGAAAR